MAAAQTELSMDEILASIRRIIDEEEEPSVVGQRERMAEVPKPIEPQVKAVKPKSLRPMKLPDFGDGSEVEDVRSAQVTTAPALADEALNAAVASYADEKALGDQRPQLVAASGAADASVPPTPAVQPDRLTSAKPAADMTIGDALAAAAQASKSAARPASSASKPEVSPREEVSAVPAPQDVAPKVAPSTSSDDKAPTATPQPKTEAPGLQAVAEKPEPSEPPQSDEQLLSEAALESAAAAFAALRADARASHGGERTTLDDLVRDMLRPMLKAWLDANLPNIVEEKVAAEIRRLSA